MQQLAVSPMSVPFFDAPPRAAVVDSAGMNFRNTLIDPTENCRHFVYNEADIPGLIGRADVSNDCTLLHRKSDDWRNLIARYLPGE